MSSQGRCSKILKSGKTCDFIATNGKNMCPIHLNKTQCGGSHPSHDHEFIFKFVISFRQGNDANYGEPASPFQIASVSNNEILEWYRTFGEEVTQYHFRGGCDLQHVTYKFNRTDNKVNVRVVMTYRDTEHNYPNSVIKENERLVAEMFADPDDNGSHPVTGNLLIKGTLNVDSLRYSVL